MAMSISKQYFVSRIMSGLADRQLAKDLTQAEADEQRAKDREYAAYLNQKKTSRGRHVTKPKFYQC